MTDPIWPRADLHQSSVWPWQRNVSTSEALVKGDDHLVSRMTHSTKILVTGVTGFVGGALVRRLASEYGCGRVVGSVRHTVDSLPKEVRQVLVEGLSGASEWRQALDGISVVVHCAALVHRMDGDAPSARQAYSEINVSGTLNLARQAVYAGVRRFVFISTIKVNGEATQPGVPFAADSEPAPLDAYGASKLEAERGLRQIEAQTGMEVVIVRPPLVYGPGVKANFANLMRWVVSGIPLPLGAVDNLRSMVSLDNLVDLLAICVKHPAAAGQVFLVSDGEDLSTANLVRNLARALGKRNILLPIPVSILRMVAALLGKRAFVERVCGSLQVDIDKTRRLLDWSPPYTLDQGLKKAVEGMKP